MYRNDTRLIDIAALDNRMRALSPKRWWVAEQMMVSHTETYREWLNLARAIGDDRLFDIKRAELIRIYKTCGCDGWLART